jgi:hypothetical protein
MCPELAKNVTVVLDRCCKIFLASSIFVQNLFNLIILASGRPKSAAQIWAQG